MKKALFEVGARDEAPASLGLIDELEKIGYGEFLSAFAPHLIGTHRWNAGRENANEELKFAIDLFLLGKPISAHEFSRILPSSIMLLDEGIVIQDGPRVYIPSLALVCFLGIWLFVQRPRRNPVIYIGHDTFALTSRIRMWGVARALDLCSGPGTQGLYIAARGIDVVAVECNVVAAEIARINAKVNQVEERYKVKVGDLYDALPDTTQEFDLIVANPPLLPFPDDLFYPFVGHGGCDGLAVTWRILMGLPRWLSHRGRAQIIGTCFSDGYLPCAMEKFREMAVQCGLTIQISIVGHTAFAPGTPCFDSLAMTASFGLKPDAVEEVRQSLARIAEEAGATHLCYFSIFAQKGKPQVDILDLSEDSRQTLWFAD